MPSRILREGILTSDRVDRLDAEGEVFYRRLMSVVDDFGRFSADSRLLIAACYPLRARIVTDEAIATHLHSICAANLAIVYEIAGKKYLQLNDFKQQIRAKVSKFPAPDAHTLITCVAPAQHLQASVYLGGGAAEVVSLSQDGGGGAAEGESDRAAPPGLEKVDPTARAIQIAVLLRQNKIQGASGQNPHVINWANDGVTDAECVEAIRIAREDRGKGDQPFPIGYLSGIVADLRNPPERKPAAPAWWTTDDGIVNRAKELGVDTRPGEDWAGLKRRVQEAERAAERAA